MVRDTAELFGKDRECSHFGTFWNLRTLLEEKKQARGSWSGSRTECGKELRGGLCGMWTEQAGHWDSRAVTGRPAEENGGRRWSVDALCVVKCDEISENT